MRYLWLPFLIGIFLISFDLKYDAVGVTFIALAIQSIAIFHFSASRNVNLLSVFSLFALLFLSLVPWLNYSAGVTIWRSSEIPDLIYLTTNAMILLANAVVILLYTAFPRHNQPPAVEAMVAKNAGLTKCVLVFLSGTSFLVVFYVNGFSIPQLLFRGLIDEQRLVVIESVSLNLLLGLPARLTTVFCFLYAATQLRRSIVTKSILLLLMILSVFPTGVSRYTVAFAYTPLLLVFVPAMRRTSYFGATLLFSVIFVFPLLNQFRYFSGLDSLTLLPSMEFFHAAHFDAYENLASAIESNFVSYGYQLLGAVLFFVPRTIWPGKPVGSGYEMAEHLGYNFNNISMPLLGEGYVNFGFIGVLLFVALLGCLMAKLDNVFASRMNSEGRVDYKMTIYYFLVGALFFLLRGDLMSSFAYISAGLAMASFVGLAMKLINSVTIRR